jgi:hypothetical protein
LSKVDAKKAIETFRQAAELNLDDPLLEGSCLHLPDYGQLVMTGDMHGHMRNFEKLQRFARLDKTPVRHVILHELIHEETPTFSTPDESHLLLLQAAEYKCQFPEQVHFLQSNHELAQMSGSQITKAGRAVCADYEAGVRSTYGSKDFEDVLEAMYGFIASHPVAARTPNRIFCSHSLPDDSDMPRFDPTVVNRRPTPEDLNEGGSVHMLVWGRRWNVAQLEHLRKVFDVDIFLVGHTPQEMGYTVLDNRVIILASDHSHGVFLPFDLKRKYDIDQLSKCIRKYVAVI